MKVTLSVADTCPNKWLPDEKRLVRWFQAAVSQLELTSAETSVGVAVLGIAEACQFNQRYRGKNYATNVLSFPSALPEDVQSLLDETPLGDLVFCPEIVESESKAQQKSLEQHWAHLSIHGLFHLLGYDHQCPDSENEMESLEIAALKTLGFPNPYLLN